MMVRLISKICTMAIFSFDANRLLEQFDFSQSSSRNQMRYISNCPGAMAAMLNRNVCYVCL